LHSSFSETIIQKINILSKEQILLESNILLNEPRNIPKRYVIVIGNNNYKDKPLNYSIKDAIKFKDFVATLNFKTFIQLDANDDSWKKSIQWLKKKINQTQWRMYILLLLQWTWMCKKPNPLYANNRWKYNPSLRFI